ncbi:uncharacterized protein FOMMEDRAFT_29658 [Fomitiporia mediterranea MF3/22]|uniref:uncharacterized protein n=1 Tax=Fomitiporia mediterranea (strain MF3/22) TaxID=694068 RepID=UPI00044086D5|nr:uncharacterized protein FOMMEDRAFT_29658 [Fomitiporia mediterranea MF3/22]EJD00849.1 hypothetical protein FOMMEDRAFT_29658 [Fomitiporia mediterranea MF3/22]
MSAIVVEQYIILGTFTALLYDSVITKDNESNPWNVNSAVFFVLRYVGLLGGLAFVIYTDFGSSVRICGFVDYLAPVYSPIQIKVKLPIGYVHSVILYLYESWLSIKLYSPLNIAFQRVMFKAMSLYK